MASIKIPDDDDFDDDVSGEWGPDNDEEVGAEKCCLCREQPADAADDFNDRRLAVCAGCAFGGPLGLALEALAAGARRRGGTEAEHQRVMRELLWRYRYAAGLPDGNGIELFLKRLQPPRDQSGT
jgi:hypothetical protein